MTRIALLAPRDSLREVLVRVADAGVIEFDETDNGGREAQSRVGGIALSELPPDPEDCERRGRLDLLAGEEELQARVDQAFTEGEVAGLVGWIVADELAPLAERVGDFGGALAPLARPRGVDPPTQLREDGISKEFDPLVDTYATLPYSDVNPAVLAGLAYVVMFGMMFADVGHGLMLLVSALAVRWGWSPRLTRLRPAWLFLAGAGLFSMIFGALYGEFFGPTGVIPVVWLEPLENAVPLLGAAVAVGAVLLASAYALGSVNRFREGGWRRMLYASAGVAGATVFLGVGLLAAGLYFETTAVLWLGSVVGLVGLVAVFIGLFTAAGGGVSGAFQALIETFDVVVRLGSNLVSFARLAAFGLTHAALGMVIWEATTALADRGFLGVVGAVLVFLAGNAVAFALEGLVAAIQALRLEYYELFSRIFTSEGRPFRPWHIPLQLEEK
ncbi:V-type ATPase 116kDa subunit family protein [Nocardioides sp.]|uniref:V-type ATPase 116kDa subunit family protein n=1 Tax=Nocardioides sp. TaxID=35761 RepID=UPI003562F21C